MRKKTNEWMNTAQDTASDLFETASDAFKTVSSTVSGTVSDIKLPDIEAPQFLKDLFSGFKGDGKGTGKDDEPEGGHGHGLTLRK